MDQAKFQEIKWRLIGCTNGNCAFGHPGGMHTNGPCHCIPRPNDRHYTATERLSLRSKVWQLAQDKAALVEALEKLLPKDES